MNWNLDVGFVGSKLGRTFRNSKYHETCRNWLFLFVCVLFLVSCFSWHSYSSNLRKFNLQNRKNKASLGGSYSIQHVLNYWLVSSDQMMMKMKMEQKKKTKNEGIHFFWEKPEKKKRNKRILIKSLASVNWLFCVDKSISNFIENDLLTKGIRIEIFFSFSIHSFSSLWCEPKNCTQISTKSIKLISEFKSITIQ